MKWPGLKEAGITYSLASKWYGSDPFEMYLYLGLGLEEDKPPEDNLMWGDVAHHGLEHLIAKPILSKDFEPEDWGDIYQSMEEYAEDKWPTMLPQHLHSTKRMMGLYNDLYKLEYENFYTELPFSVPYKTASGIECTLRGKVDGIEILENKIGNQKTNIPRSVLDKYIGPNRTLGGTLVEHKFKGRYDRAKEAREIPVDLQSTMYMFATGARKVIYDVIRIPDTQYALPPRRQRQSLTNYVDELYFSKNWGDFPVASKRLKWIYQDSFEFTDEDIEYRMRTTVDPVIEQIHEWYEFCSQPNFDPFDVKNYGKNFYKRPLRLFDPAKTQTWEGPYYDLHTGQIDIDELIPIKGFYNELPSETPDV